MSSVAIAVSIVAICVVAFRWRPFTIDSLGFFGWITGALSLLVLVVTVYQIITVHSLKKEIRRIAKEEDSIIFKKLKSTILLKENQAINGIKEGLEDINNNILGVLYFNIKMAGIYNHVNSFVEYLNYYILYTALSYAYKYKGYPRTMDEIFLECTRITGNLANEQKIIRIDNAWMLQQIYTSQKVIKDGDGYIPDNFEKWVVDIAAKNGIKVLYESTIINKENNKSDNANS